MRLTRPDAAAMSLLALLPTLLWWPLLTGALPDFMDTVMYLYPIRMALAEQLQAGVLPLWNPHMMAGVPMAANPQLATWYPPQVLFALWPGPVMYGLLCVLHAVWGGWGAYFFVRMMTHDRLAGLFAGVVFVLGPFVVSRLALAPHLYTIVWIPWILLAIERAATERGWLPGRWGCVVALALTMQILAGAPQITTYTALILPIWWVGRWWSFRADGASVPRFAQVLAQGALAAFAAFLLCGIQLLPTLEFLGQTARSAISPDRLIEQGLNGSMIWRALIGFTASPIEDTDSIHAVGLGVIVLACAAMAARGTRRAAMLLVMIGALGWLLSLGRLVPVWSSILPLYESFHAPRRALVLWSATGPLAGGLGAAVLAQRWAARGWPRWSLALLLSGFALGTIWILPRLEREFADPARFAADGRALVAIGDDRFITMDPTLDWSHGSRRPEFGRSLISNLAPLHGVYDANGYDPLVLARMAELRDFASGRAGVWYPSHGVYLADPTSPLLRVLNVQSLVGRWDLFDPGTRIPGASVNHSSIAEQVSLTVDDERWPVWRYNEDRPFAWAVEQVFEVLAAEDAFHALLQSDGLRVAFVEGAPPDAVRLSVPLVDATWRNARTVELTMEGDVSGPSFFCVSVAWMPGWRARTDTGEALHVVPAQGAICGIAVPAGVRSITLRYEPTSFVQGVMLTLGGLLLLTGLWLRAGQQVRGNASRVGHEGEGQPLRRERGESGTINESNARD